MHIADLVKSRDGSLSLTKLAAATAHFLMAVAFIRLQVLAESADFNESLWLIYGMFAIGHASYDKTANMVKEYRERSRGATPHEEPARGCQCRPGEQ